MRFLMVIFALVLSACMVNPIPAYRPCRCEAESCASNSCTFTFTLDESCAGEVSEAEILVDDHLELDTIVPGESVVACSRTEPGETSVVYVRGGDWIWGPIVRKCGEEGNENFPLVLQCKDLSTESAPE
jgi:hypothetical protein